MRIEDFLTAAARRWPGKVALVCGERRMTFAELDAASDAIAAALAARGVRRGDRVAILAENDADTAIAIFGSAKAGAVFSPIHPATKPAKLRQMLDHCRAAALVAGARLLLVAEEAAAGSAHLRCALVAAPGGTRPRLPGAILFDEALATAGRPPAAPGIALDLGMLVWTSGSTGRPKGVMLTHRNVEAAADACIAYLGNDERDVILNVLPLSHSYGLYQLLTAVKVGATLVLERSFAFPQAVLARMAEERVTGLPVVPTIVAMLLRQDAPAGAFDDLRYLTVAGAALPPAHLDALRAMLPRTAIIAMYGQTECKRISWLPPGQIDRRPGSCGIPIPGTEAWIVDESGRRVPPGTVGELVVRGEHVMQGYWEDPEATARALRPGPNPWERVLHTGDLFRADADGFLTFVGRMDDIIKTRGEKVAPKEIEAVLYELPVEEAAVIGVPDPVLGMAIKAVLVPRPGATLTAREVQRHCAARLEEFMVPKLVEFRDALPKTDNGKISRRAVAGLVEVA
ncbi:class I adenylate-forming enzyme family protein [Falsiroseomonas sp. HW251]|uniref:class I adenylate-forming enzyme family protein n=1 Tax=Falsiroseomonas sp. HW251 TaxID=3390998 RepID=UPI003D321AEF